MRHFLLALLIALLPLRGWVGDAMATQMAAGQIQHSQQAPAAAIKTAAAHAHDAGATAHFDHEEVAALVSAAEPDCAGHGAGENTPADDGHCESCAACQACNTVALSLMEPDLSPVTRSITLPTPAADPFASADAALRQKPPISRSSGPYWVCTCPPARHRRLLTADRAGSRDARHRTRMYFRRFL